jgi:hypothetical protein
MKLKLIPRLLSFSKDISEQKSNKMIQSLQSLFTRDLNKLKTEIESYQTKKTSGKPIIIFPIQPETLVSIW